MDYRKQAIEAAHQVQMIQLTGEAAKTVQEHEKKVTEELTKQLKARKEISDTIRSQEEGAAFGPLEEKEAKINALLREQAKLRDELVKKGATPEDLARFDIAAQKKLDITRFGEEAQGMAQAIVNGFSSVVDALMEGGQNLKQALNGFFKSLFKQSLEPGIKQLTQFLMSGFKNLFGELGAGLASAILGVIGLLGMLLTSSSQGSSWSPSGVQSSVTSHEAVRGIIAGETSIPIAQIGESLQDALVPTNSILRQIEINTRGGKAGGGSLDISVTVKGIEEQINAAIERYFREYLVMGATG